MARKAAFEAKPNRKSKPRKNEEFAVMGTLPLEPTFFDSISIRETIESIAVAIILAMIFKTLEAEAYVIPTGSMAPTLMGQHVEIECSECGYWYQTGSLDEGPSGQNRQFVTGVRCPMCHRDRSLNRKISSSYSASTYDPNEESFSGDRIVVSKIEYIFRDPERWDVIVFKYPGNGKQNYIKRLVGLPGEQLTLNNGDVLIRNEESAKISNDDPDLRSRLIARKSGRKLASIMIPVQDTKYFSPTMRAVGLPPAWIPWTGSLDLEPTAGADASPWSDSAATQNQWQTIAEGAVPASFKIESSEAEKDKVHWLRFRDLLPTRMDWETAEKGDPLSPTLLSSPGTLVTDYYCYSDSNEKSRVRAAVEVDDYNRIGSNWVGDLVMEADVSVSSGSGKIRLDAVEGGVHYLCTIDVATGKATVSTASSLPNVEVAFANESGAYALDSIEFETPVKGAGSYQFRFANCDDRIYLWVNGAEIALPNSGLYSRRGPLFPVCLPNDPADAQPLGIGAEGISMTVDRLAVFRDLFYTDFIFNQAKDTNLAAPEQNVKQFFMNPRLWSDQRFQKLFQPWDSNNQVDWEQSFALDEDQFFPMGDNSPSSKDARVWEVDHYVDRSMLIGKALMVYWPHTWNNPPYWPNFGRMRVIR